MKRWIIYLILGIACFAGGQQKASAQWLTFDASNLTQSILSFLQDADNMTLNTAQFLQNLGVMEEQLKFLNDMDKRYREVRADLYKVQDVIRIANNYENSVRMFSRYVDRLKSLDGDKLEYYQVRSVINEGFQYLLFASREVKRAREFLSENSEISEEERRKGLKECDRSVSKANLRMYNHIMDSLGEIDRGERVVSAVEHAEEYFSIKY